MYDTVRPEQEEYDIPPRHQPPGQQEIYDIPPSRQQTSAQVRLQLRGLLVTPVPPGQRGAGPGLRRSVPLVDTSEVFLFGSGSFWSVLCPHYSHQGSL